MDSEKVKIAEIDIGVDALLSKAATTKKRLEELKTANRELKKETDGLTSASQEQAEQFTRQEIEIKKLSKEYRDSTKVVDAYVNIQNTEIKTKEQARNANLKLIAIANKLDATNADQKKQLEKINKEIDKNTDFIKQNSSEYEKTKINIGNYSSEIQNALGQTGIFGQVINKTTGEGQVFSGVFTKLKGDLNDGISTIRGNTAATEGMSKAQKAAAVTTNLTSGALKLFRVALIATGIGAIVVLLAALVSYFSSTQEGIDKVNRVLTPLKIVFESLFGVLQDVGKAMADVFTIDGLKKVADFVQDQLVARFTGLKDIVAGIFTFDLEQIKKGTATIKEANDEIIDIAMSGAESLNATIQEAYARGVEIQRLTEEIETAEINLNLNRQIGLNLIKEQELIAKDKNKTDQERNEALKIAVEQSKLIAEEDKRILDLKIKQLELEQKSNDTSRAEQKELADLRAERLKKDAEQAAVELRFLGVKNQLENEARKRVEAANKKAVDDRLKAQKILLENFKLEQGFRNQTLEEQIANARKELEITKVAELEKLKAKRITQEEYDLFILESQQKIAKLEAEFAVEIGEVALEEFKKTQQSKLEAGEFFNQQLFEQELERINRIAEAERENERIRFEQKLINQQELNDALAEIDNANFQKQETLKAQRKAAQAEQEAFELALQQEIELERAENRFEQERIKEERRYDAEVAAAERLGLALTDIEKKHAAAKVAIDEAQFNARLDQAEATFGGVAKLIGEQTAIGKAAGIAQAVINTYQGVTEVLKTPSIFPEPFATAQKAVSIGTVVASGIGAVNRISNTKVPRAERGIGIDINGPDHSAGGTMIYDQYGNPLVEAQGGEKMVILNRGATAELNALSRLNQKHGGVSLSQNVSYAENGGAVSLSSRSANVGSVSQSIDIDAFADAISTRVNSIKIAVPVPDVLAVANNIQAVEAGANF